MMSEESDELQNQNRAKVKKMFNDSFNYGCHLMNGGEYNNYKYRIAEESVAQGHKMFEFMMQQYRQLRKSIIEEDINKPGILNQLEIANEFFQLNKNESFQRVANFDFSNSEKTNSSNDAEIKRKGKRKKEICKMLDMERIKSITHNEKLEVVKLFKKNPNCKISEIRKKTGIKYLRRDRINSWANQLRRKEMESTSNKGSKKNSHRYDLQDKRLNDVERKQSLDPNADEDVSKPELNSHKKSPDMEKECDKNSVDEDIEMTIEKTSNKGAAKKMPILFSPVKIVGRPISHDEEPPNLSRETNIEEMQHVVSPGKMPEKLDKQPRSLPEQSEKIMVKNERINMIELSDNEDSYMDHKGTDSSVSHAENSGKLSEYPGLFGLLKSNEKDSPEEYVSDNEVEILMAIISIPDAP